MFVLEHIGQDNFGELFEKIATKRENALFSNMENRINQLNSQSESFIENIKRFDNEKSGSIRKTFKLMLISVITPTIVAVGSSSYAIIHFFLHKPYCKIDKLLWALKNILVEYFILLRVIKKSRIS